jgi:hypothetical protein
MEFTSVELAGGVELIAPMEKVAAGLVEKAAAGGRHSGEERKTDRRAWAWWRCRPAERRRWRGRCGGERGGALLRRCGHVVR